MSSTMAQRESAHESELLYSKMPVMLHSTDIDGRLCKVNDYWLETLGYDRDEVIGREATLFLTPHARTYAETTCLPKFFETGSVRNEELQFLTKSGKTIDVLLSAIAERDSNDRPIRSHSVSIDVTKRRRLETLLREAKREIQGHNGHVQSLTTQLSAAKQRELERRRLASDLYNSTAQIVAMAKFDVRDTTSHVNHHKNGGFAKLIDSTMGPSEPALTEKELESAVSEIGRLKDQLRDRNIEIQAETATVSGFEQIVGNSPALRRCFDLVAMAAPTNVNVLILGETGTGKELIANALHKLSPRKDRAMVSVNCAALPAELIESELFGHEKGAFTGAQSRRPGRYELADGGTIFLDEIGDLPLKMQAKLLRVIQEGEFQRLGGNDTLHVDVRLIAATNRQLNRAVDQGDFRSDLYYRINTFPINVPSLNERREDIPLLAKHFIRKHAASLGKETTSISTRLLRHLSGRDWPGNVRELENFIIRSIVEGTDSSLMLSQQNESLIEMPVEPIAPGKDKNSLSQAERDHIIEVLNECKWTIEGANGASTLLGVPASTLRSKMKRLRIERPA